MEIASLIFAPELLIGTDLVVMSTRELLDTRPDIARELVAFTPPLAHPSPTPVAVSHLRPKHDPTIQQCIGCLVRLTQTVARTRP